jgi:GNAT superfamily N-acetyltransferase
MYFREANTNDIPELHRIRMSVKENVLNNPLLVQEKDYINYLTTEGKGWLCEIENQTVGFAIVDASKQNLWALFVEKSHEGRGIGKELERLLLDWWFRVEHKSISLSTAPNTRAENFYRSSGWKEKGSTKNGELIFEMTEQDWKHKMINDTK